MNLNRGIWIGALAGGIILLLLGFGIGLLGGNLTTDRGPFLIGVLIAYLATGFFAAFRQENGFRNAVIAAIILAVINFGLSILQSLPVNLTPTIVVVALIMASIVSLMGAFFGHILSRKKN